MSGALSIGNGYRVWRNEAGEFHREDGPAVEYENGDKEWYLSGIKHREDGPAVEWANGTKQWWVYGKRHRKDGPAIEEDVTGYKAWYIFDNYCSYPVFLTAITQHHMKLHLLSQVLPAGAENLVDKYVL
jgi:hypothetical protein